MNILEQYKDAINGSFTFFDRIIIKGHLNRFFTVNGAGSYASQCGVLLKDFSAYAQGVTEDLKKHIENLAKEKGRPLVYVRSPKESKEDIALKALKDSPLEEGLICIISAVEECFSLEPRKNEKGLLELRKTKRKCLHYYFYLKDRKLGFMYLRLESWFPFEIQIYINGRELMRPVLEKEGIEYSMYDNSFSFLSDIDKAQKLADKQADKARELSAYFDKLAKEFNPYLSVFRKINTEGYRWYLYQCEIATDIMFKSREKLEDIYPSLVDHAFYDLGCEDVFTFMGRKLDNRFQGEAITDYKKRPIGWRVKFRLNSNHLKFYDKGNCLRIELTINDPYAFRIMKKTKDKKGNEVKKWIPMGKALSNLYRYIQIGKECNFRMINALKGAVPVASVIADIEKVSRRTRNASRSVSACNLWNEETYLLLKTIADGSFLVSGFRNSDIRDTIYPDTEDKNKRSARTSRTLRKLRDHHLIRKISHSSRYQLSKKGRQIISAVIHIREHMYPEAAALFV